MAAAVSFAAKTAANGAPTKVDAKDIERLSKGDHQTQLRWIIDPRTNKCIAYWDLATAVALIFTALVTPFEVAFLEQPVDKWRDSVFLLNRMVDLIFIADICIQFRTAYRTEDVQEGVRWVLNGGDIAWHYVCSFWFPLDVFSVLTSLFDLLGNASTKDLTALRAIRTLRLIKLVKLARGSRIFKRWEMRLSIDYALLSIVQVVVYILVSCHWFACIWALQATFAPLTSWTGFTYYCIPWGADNVTDAQSLLQAADCPGGDSPTCSLGVAGVMRDAGCPASHPVCDTRNCHVDGMCSSVACVAPFEMYSYSLYFSIMTVTSVGYGDIHAAANNPVEQWFCSAIMMFSGIMWGYLVGVFCTLAAASPSVQAFRDELSNLNSFMSAYNLNPELRFRLREFLHETVHLRNTHERTQLLAKLSPAMQGEVSLLVNQRWLSKVWYLHSGVQLELLIEIANKLHAQVFAPWEFCPCGCMYIVNRGTALYAGRPVHAGATWGEDILLDRPDLQLDFSAVATSYLWVYTLDAMRLKAAIKKFPGSAELLAGVRQKWILRRAVVRYAEYEMHRRGMHFRGRFYPIYAKDIKERLITTRQNTEPIAVVRISKLGRMSRIDRLSTSMRSSTRRSQAEAMSPGRLWPLRRAQTVAVSPGTPGGLSPAAATPKSGRKTGRAERSRMQCSQTAKTATANFGLQLREEQLKLSEQQDAMAKEIKLQELVDTVGQLQRGMDEILRRLGGSPLPPGGGAHVAPPVTPSPARGTRGHGASLPPLNEDLGGGDAAAAPQLPPITAPTCRSSSDA